MGDLDRMIDSEFSVSVIGELNRKLDKISALVSANMDRSVYDKLEDELYAQLVSVSKDFFTQGLLRGIAVAKGEES